jgi:ADP-L-glycero-D-manno-heptose 6-epimerase
MNIKTNYKYLKNGIIKQINVNKIEYNYEYSNKYNIYNEKSIHFSYLRLGVLIGALGFIPNSILDVGYGNGDFLKIAPTAIKKCYGADITDYPIPNNCTKVEISENKFYDVVCFFDSLEHFDDINFINNLNCNYVFISVPWCHDFSEEWFNKWYHLKPNEHLWHFNKSALDNFFNENNYECIYSSNHEDIIRKNINSKYYPNILSCLYKNINKFNKFEQYYKDKIIVVTGGTGFIGKNIVDELLKYTSNIIIFDRTIKYKWNNKNIIYIEGNLCNDSDIEKLNLYNFEILFHEAANVDTTCEDTQNMFKTNFEAFKKIVSICQLKNAKLIYASSAATYGNTSVPNIVDKNEIPLNIYGESKLMMDDFLRNNLNKLNNIVIGLRYFNVYGNNEKHKNNMMSMVTQMITKIKDGINVNLFEFGEQKRDFIYVKDIVKCNLLAGISKESGIYNCGTGESVDFNNIFDIIISYYKSDSKINYIKNNYTFFQNETKADIQKTTLLLQFTPDFDIIKGIYDYIKNIN